VLDTAVMMNVCLLFAEKATMIQLLQTSIVNVWDCVVLDNIKRNPFLHPITRNIWFKSFAFIRFMSAKLFHPYFCPFYLLIYNNEAGKNFSYSDTLCAVLLGRRLNKRLINTIS